MGLTGASGAPSGPACRPVADSMRATEAIVSGSAAIARNWSCHRSR